MAIEQIIKERNNRLRTITSFQQLRPLLMAGFLDEDVFLNTQFQAIMFIRDCVTKFYRLDNISFNLKDHKQYVLNLPNLTPNGLLLPKLGVDNTYYSFVHAAQELVKTFLVDGYLGLASPVNLRISRGTNATQYVINRPTSSYKWHSDIWAGQNSNECMVHIPLLGDIENNGISFALPNENFLNYVSHQPNFDIENIREKEFPVKLEMGMGYCVDSWLIHKTECNSDDLRVILSFPIRLKPIDSDTYFNSERDAEYLSYNDWMQIGRTKFFEFTDKLEYQAYEDKVQYHYAQKFKYK